MRIILLCLLFSLSSCVLMQEDNSWIVTEKSLNGVWQFQLVNGEQGRSDIEPSAVSSMIVPGHWKTVGLDYAGTVKYSRQVELAPLSANSRYWLIVGAADYASDITVNNQVLSRQEGYFLPHRTEITSAIFAGDNQVDIVVHSPNEPLGEDWSLNKHLIKGVLNHHDTRPGGAWSDHGQDWNSGGIWGDVSIRQTGPVAINQLAIVPQLLEQNARLPKPGRRWPTAADITIELNSLQPIATELTFTLTERETGEAEQWTSRQQLEMGDNTVLATVPIKDRLLWWPWDWGKPNLYDLRVDVVVAGQVSDQHTTAAGFRQIVLDSDEKKFRINSHPYFIRGTNYIASQWLGEVSPKQYQADFGLMKEANINSVRVHAHVAGRVFYDLADEQGMLVWQDFPLQWGYADTPQLKIAATKQAKAMTQLLSNHPSIVIWCGHNEPPWDASWMQYKYSSYRPGQNVVLTDEVYQTLRDAKDSRVVRKASYTHEHPWLGWYSGSYRDYADFSPPMIVSEFGAQAMPNWLMVQSLIESSSPPPWPLSGEALAKLAYHNYQSHETLNIAHIQQGESLSQFWNNSQEYQRVVTKFAAEHLRLRKDEGIAAIYQFMFVDSWPAVTWSVVDVERQVKPAYTELAIAYQPVLPVVVFNPRDLVPKVTIMAINDTLQAWDNISLVVRNRYGKGQWRFEGLTLAPNQIQMLVENKVLAGLSAAMEIVLLDSSGEVLAVNQYRVEDF